VLTGVVVDVSKLFGVRAGVLKRGAGAESKSEKCDSTHLCSPVFGPSARGFEIVRQQFFSDDVIPGRYEPLLSACRKFLFFAKFQNLTTNFCCYSPHVTVLPTFRLICFHPNQWTTLGINQSNQHYHLQSVVEA